LSKLINWMCVEDPFLQIRSQIPSLWSHGRSRSSPTHMIYNQTIYIINRLVWNTMLSSVVHHITVAPIHCNISELFWFHSNLRNLLPIHWYCTKLTSPCHSCIQLVHYISLAWTVTGSFTVSSIYKKNTITVLQELLRAKYFSDCHHHNYKMNIVFHDGVVLNTQHRHHKYHEPGW